MCPNFDFKTEMSKKAAGTIISFGSMDFIWYYPAIDEAAIMAPYGNEVGLAALEWLENYTTDILPEEWLTSVITRILDKKTSLSEWVSRPRHKIDIPHTQHSFATLV